MARHAYPNLAWKRSNERLFAIVALDPGLLLQSKRIGRGVYSGWRRSCNVLSAQTHLVVLYRFVSKEPDKLSIFHKEGGGGVSSKGVSHGSLHSTPYPAAATVAR